MSDAIQKHYTFKLMFTVNGRTSKGFLSFSSWLITGFAAIVAVLIANLDAAISHTSAITVTEVIRLFIYAAIVHFCQRFIGLFIETQCGGAQSSNDNPPPALLNFDMFFADMRRGLFWPGTYFLDWTINKLRKGDFLALPVLGMRLNQLQGVLVLWQSYLAVQSALWIAESIH
jgi:hypothetical protein